MNGKGEGDRHEGDANAGGKAAERKARLADSLRANLLKRKAQARSRRQGDADQRPEGLAAADPERT